MDFDKNKCPECWGRGTSSCIKCGAKNTHLCSSECEADQLKEKPCSRGCTQASAIEVFSVRQK